MIFKLKQEGKSLFSTVLPTVLAVTMSFSLLGCNFLKGKPKKQEIIEIKSADVECMKDVPTKFEKLMESNSTEEDIDKSFACIQKTLEQFKTKVEGRTQADLFTSEELFTIFDKFFKDAKISQKATEEILVLKRALLGGDDNTITKLELEMLKDYLKVLQVEVKKLAPYIKVFKVKKGDEKFDLATIQLAFSQLRESLKVLLKASKIGRSQYNFEDLKQLATSLEIVEDQEDQQMVDLTENVVNLLSGTEPLKSSEDYLIAIDNFVDLAQLYAEGLHTDLKFEISSRAQLDRVLVFADRILTALENSLQYRKHKILEVKYLDPIVSEILKSGLVPVEVTQSTFINFYKLMVIRVFNDQKTLAPESLVVLKEINFKNIRRELTVYKLYQNMINSLDYSAKGHLPINQFKAQVKAYSFAQALTKEVKAIKDRNVVIDDIMQKQILQALEEFKAEAVSRYAIVFRQKKMIQAINQNNATASWEDVSRALFTKMLAREMMQGWGVLDPNLVISRSQMLETGFIQWYGDFKAFAIEIKLFDPRTINSGAKSFLEANLFTYAGNGDQSLNYTELMQYVSMLISGGGEMTDMIQKDMPKAGCQLKEIDVFGNPWLDEKCFIANLRRQQNVYFTHIFNFSRYLSSLNDKQFTEYYYSLMSVARNDEKTIGRVETADIRTFTMLAMYIEALYGVYDVENPADSFNPREIRASYPRFKAFVNNFAQTTAKDKLEQWDKFYNICSYSYTKEEFIREAFIFMVYTGRLPELEDMNYVTCGVNGLFTFTGEVDRKTIISTFQVLKTVLSSLDGKTN